jgi:uncharacterized protein YndB with AHSA1/START domain
MAANGNAATAERELVITRVFDAPRRLVFQVWTDPKHLKQWWGPRGFTVLSCELDLRPGGAWRIRSRAPEGKEHVAQGVFREIVEPERLVFTHAWVDAEGRPGHETLVTVTFAEQNGKTLFTFHQGVFASITSREAHEKGWSSTFDLLVEYLAKV